MKYLVIIITMLTLTSTLFAQGSEPIDPNILPFGIDPNAYEAPITYWTIGEPNIAVNFKTTLRNKGGWNNELDVTMADGTPTTIFMQPETAKPVKDPDTNSFKKVFNWGWMPPSEGVFYLELRSRAKGRPTWKVDKKTVIIYCYGEDTPWIWSPYIPFVTMEEKAKTWQYLAKAKVRSGSVAVKIQLLDQLTNKKWRNYVIYNAGLVHYRGPIIYRP